METTTKLTPAKSTSAHTRRTRRPPLRPHFRDYHEILLQRSQHLPITDRLLIHQAFDRGRPIPALAAEFHCPPSTLRRRIRRLTARLLDPAFLLATQFAHRLEPTLVPIARSYYADRLTLRQCAIAQRVSVHRVPQALSAVHTCLRLAHHDRDLALCLARGRQKITAQYAQEEDRDDGDADW